MQRRRGRARAALPLVLLTILLALWPTAAYASPGEVVRTAQAAGPLPATLCDPSGTAALGSPGTATADLAAANSQWAVATKIYGGVLESANSTPQAKACAVRGLKYVAANQRAHSPATVPSSAWDAFFADWVRPVLNFGVPAFAFFVAFLLAMRIATSWMCRPDSPGLRRHTWLRRSAFFGAWLVGMVAAGWAAVMLTVGLSLASGGEHTWAIGWMQQVAWIVLAVALACGAAALRLVGHRPHRSRVAGLAAAVLAATGLAVGSVFITGASPGRSWEAVAVLGVATALAGIALAARVRGLRMGVRFTATSSAGTDDNGLAGDIRSRLYALAGQDPHGIQVTQQTDVSSLPDDAVNLLPEGTLQRALNLVVKLFTAAEPWRVHVVERGDGALSVSITRNGLAVDSAVITPAAASLLSLDPDVHPGLEPLDADKTKQALRVAVAARLLLTLSERHAHLRSGLAGATKWESLTAQVIAADRAFELTPDGKLALLADAVALDGGNLAARMAYLRRFLAPDTVEARRSFVRGLWDVLREANEEEGDVALRMRVWFNIAAGSFNLALLEKSENMNRAWASLLQAHNAALELRRQMDKRSSDKSFDRFLADMRPAAYWVHRCIDSELAKLPVQVAADCAGDTPDTALTPMAQYQRACFYAELDPAKALADLEAVLYQPNYRPFAGSDPSLQPLFDLDGSRPELAKRFRELVGKPLAGDELELAPFVNRKVELAARGITSLRAIAGISTDGLCREFGLSRLTAQHWEDVAALYDFVDRHSGAAPDRAATTDLLVRSGIGSVGALRVRLTTDGVEGLRLKLREKAKPYAVLPPSRQTIELWQNALDGPDGAVAMVGPFWVTVG